MSGSRLCPEGGLFESAAWYDRSINWAARLGREIPLFTAVFGPPADGGILDAGCGSGRQAVALARCGYRVTGADASAEMLSLASHHARLENQEVRFVAANYAQLQASVGGGFDGLLCIGNALAAAGSRDAVREAIGQFAACLRVGGRLFLQVLNFPPMRRDRPCVRGPRTVTVDGVEYVSARHFHFGPDTVEVTNITMYRDKGAWRQHAHSGTLYPMDPGELDSFCAVAGLNVEEHWGGYGRERFDPATSSDLLLTARRR